MTMFLGLLSGTAIARVAADSQTMLRDLAWVSL